MNLKLIPSFTPAIRFICPTVSFWPTLKANVSLALMKRVNIFSSGDNLTRHWVGFPSTNPKAEANTLEISRKMFVEIAPMTVVMKAIGNTPENISEIEDKYESKSLAKKHVNSRMESRNN